MRQKQAEGVKRGTAGSRKNDAVDQKNASGSGSSNAAKTKATSSSSSPQSDSTPSIGTSKISELRNALMGSLKRNQAAARDINQRRNGGRYQQQYQQSQNDRRPSWRDRAQVREQMKGGIGGVNYAEESPQELASEKILREMEEAKQEAIQAVQEAGMLQGASSEDKEEEEDESNTIALPNRSMSLSELS